VVVVPASYLALLHIGVGWVTTALAMVAAVLLALRRLRRTGSAADERLAPPALETLVALPFVVVTVVVLANASRTFAVRPLVEWDSWALWAAKARLLYELPGAAPGVLNSSTYGAPSYPLAFPTLQALAFRAMGTYDGTLVGVQLLLLAFGLVAALWGLLRGVARPPVIALAALVIVTAPQFLYQLLTHYADVPLAIFVAAGVAAGGTWLVTDGVDAWALVCLVAFLGMATLTKNEGLLYAAACLAALIAAAATVGRARVRRATVAAAAVLAIALPWRVYTILLDLRPTDYDLSNAFRPSYLRDHADRLDTAVPELWRQIVATEHWGYVVPIVLLALISGATGRRWRVSLYAAVWLTASFGGLLITYWVSVLPVESNLSNSSYRTIVSLIAGGIAVTPLLLFPRTEEDRAVLATGAHLALRPAEEEAQPEPPATGHKSPGTGR
jgi:hypothetical protein